MLEIKPSLPNVKQNRFQEIISNLTAPKITTTSMDIALAPAGKRLTQKTMERKTNRFHEEIKSTNNFFFITPYKMGDTFTSLRYINAMMNTVDIMNPNATCTLVTSETTYDLLKPLEEKRPLLKVMKGSQIDQLTVYQWNNLTHNTSDEEYNRIDKYIDNWRPLGRKTVSDLLRDQKISGNVCVFDFEDTQGQIDEVTSKETKRDKGGQVTLFKNLFSELFPFGNKNFGVDRYDAYSKNFFHIQSDLPIRQMEVPLPKDHELLYESLVERFGIDPSKPQVSIVLESGSPGRQYPLAQYVEVAKLMQEIHPDIAFNFIVNRNKKINDLTRVDEEKLLHLLQERQISNAHIVSGSLSELISLFHKQKVVISNDGGIFQLAASMEEKPTIVGIFVPTFETFWAPSVANVIAVNPPYTGQDIQAMRNIDYMEETDDTKKLISVIPPQHIAEPALRSFV